MSSGRGHQVLRTGARARVPRAPGQRDTRERLQPERHHPARRGKACPEPDRVIAPASCSRGRPRSSPPRRRWRCRPPPRAATVTASVSGSGPVRFTLAHLGDVVTTGTVQAGGSGQGISGAEADGDVISSRTVRDCIPAARARGMAPRLAGPRRRAVRRLDPLDGLRRLAPGPDRLLGREVRRRRQAGRPTPRLRPARREDRAGHRRAGRLQRRGRLRRPGTRPRPRQLCTSTRRSVAGHSLSRAIRPSPTGETRKSTTWNTDGIFVHRSERQCDPGTITSAGCYHPLRKVHIPEQLRRATSLSP